MARAYRSPHGPVADLPGEEWRDWETFWEVSNLGRFKAKAREVENSRGVWRQRERLLTPHYPDGKRRVRWYRWQANGHPQSMSINRMMWIAFVGSDLDRGQHLTCDGEIRLENLRVFGDCHGRA